MLLKRRVGGVGTVGLIIAGSGGSGKSTLSRRYTIGLFSDGTKMIVETDFRFTNCETSKGKIVLQIWDFGGEERFRIMAYFFYFFFLHPLFFSHTIFFGLFLNDRKFIKFKNSIF